MTDIAVSVLGLGKQYRLGGGAHYHTLREAVTHLARTPWRWLGRARHGSARNDADNTIWALRDVSFEVRRGEVVGIIGRNGAGKSTLLKILSQITEPTTGEVQLTGRVGSLLEVGTGFHPELTGRENIFLNGAILGMKRSEIVRKFDEIVAFAEVERFIDTPVKHYSSGMYMRLAFAVAAHLEPEILVVDEVLAVGDVAFQKKCLGKMGEVAKHGRTVLFVSHNLQAVTTLCEKAILLSAGQLEGCGGAHEIANRYLQSIDQRQHALARRRRRRYAAPDAGARRRRGKSRAADAQGIQDSTVRRDIETPDRFDLRHRGLFGQAATAGVHGTRRRLASSPRGNQTRTVRVGAGDPGQHVRGGNL
jgi:lipopolysaccharide transport system ATP-binding protein